MLTTAIVSHYSKGFIKNIPFLFGLVVGYIAATIFTVTGIALSAVLIPFSKSITLKSVISSVESLTLNGVDVENCLALDNINDVIETLFEFNNLKVFK